MDNIGGEDFTNEFWKNVPDDVLEALYKDLERYVPASLFALRGHSYHGNSLS
jgi:hypothetical protein